MNKRKSSTAQPLGKLSSREEAHRAGRELSARSVMFYTLVEERLGLSVSDLRAWGLLVGLGPLSAREFADLTGLTPGAVTGLIDRLEKAGAVKRTPIRTIAARSSSRCCRNCEPETRQSISSRFRRLAGCTSDIQMTKFESFTVTRWKSQTFFSKKRCGCEKPRPESQSEAALRPEGRPHPWSQTIRGRSVSPVCSPAAVIIACAWPR